MSKSFSKVHSDKTPFLGIIQDILTFNFLSKKNLKITHFVSFLCWWPIVVVTRCARGMGLPTKVAKVTADAAMIELSAAMASIRPLPLELKRHWPWRRAVAVTEDLRKLLRERCFGWLFGMIFFGVDIWKGLIFGWGEMAWFFGGKCKQYRSVLG